MTSLRQILNSLRSAKVTAKPSKCMIVYGSALVTTSLIKRFDRKSTRNRLSGMCSPYKKKKKKKKEKKKRQTKSFLGLIVFYRRFIPYFSTITSLLTDLTKRARSNSIRDWQDQHENAFKTLKNRLKFSPILRLPFSKTDAPGVRG